LEYLFSGKENKIPQVVILQLHQVLVFGIRFKMFVVTIGSKNGKENV